MIFRNSLLLYNIITPAGLFFHIILVDHPAVSRGCKINCMRHRGVINCIIRYPRTFLPLYSELSRPLADVPYIVPEFFSQILRAI